MREKLKKFIKLIIIELEDLETDLSLMEDVLKQKAKRGEITGYVFKENVSLLTSELSGMHQLIKAVGEILTDRYSSVSALAEDLDRIFHERTEESDLPEACYAMVRRRLTKVRSYMDKEETF